MRFAPAARASASSSPAICARPTSPGRDFEAATFARVDLRKADLRGARNYVLDVCDNRVAGMRVDLPEALGLLAALRVHLEA